MAADFDPKNCPIGLIHENELKHSRDLLNMAIERIEERIETFKEGVDEHFAVMDKRFDHLEKQFTQLKEEIPSVIDTRIKQNVGNKVLNMIKWIVFTLGGSLVITLVTKLVVQAFKLS